MEYDLSALPTRPLLSEELLALMARNSLPMSNSEIIHAMAHIFNIDNSKRPPQSSKDGRSDFAYQLAWIRSDLKKKNLIRLCDDGRWEITDLGVLEVK